MLAIPHLLTGAVIGDLVEGLPYSSPLAFILGWLSHYVLDAIPHWEMYIPIKISPHFETDDPIGKWPKIVLVNVFFDILIGVSLVIFFIGKTSFWHSAIFWGALGAISPDVIDNIPFWNRYTQKLPVLKQLKSVHQFIHIDNKGQKGYLGIVSQGLIIGLMIWLLSIK